MTRNMSKEAIAETLKDADERESIDSMHVVAAQQVRELDALVDECVGFMERFLIAGSLLREIKQPTEAHIEQWVNEGYGISIPLLNKIKEARGE